MQATALMKPVALPRTRLLNVVLHDLKYEVLWNISYSVILIVVRRLLVFYLKNSGISFQHACAIFH